MGEIKFRKPVDPPYLSDGDLFGEIELDFYYGKFVMVGLVL